MAKLIPTFNSSAADMTGGEKRLGQSLEDNLEDDYIIWYDDGHPPQNSTPTDKARLLYVAMTRASERLILSYHQESAFVKLLHPLIS
jgi:superfamily I DNA/RNA helicase